MQKYARWLIALILALVTLNGGALAQSGAVIVNETEMPLDERALQEAAARLSAEGARVALFLVQAGNETDFVRRLTRVGYSNGTGVYPNVIAVYVSLNEPRFSSIMWGDNFDLALADSSIRADVLNPALRERLFTQGFSETLNALHTHITAPLAWWQVVGRWVAMSISVVNVLIVGVSVWVVFMILRPTRPRATPKMAPMPMPEKPFVPPAQSSGKPTKTAKRYSNSHSTSTDDDSHRWTSYSSFDSGSSSFSDSGGSSDSGGGSDSGDW